MKITKRQLRRIIREEKSKLLKEQFDNPVDALVQEMFTAYNNISALLDDVEDDLPIDLLGRANELLNVLEKLSEDIDASSR
tara:strand:+ start:112 stop:354 length:243 start_codon:yes stop_codon:yes gene_type:complete